MVVTILSGSGQSPLWKDYFSYRSCEHLAESENFIAGAANIGFFLYNKTTQEITKHSKITGLSDIDISAIQALSNDRFIVGYKNGNIDIVSSNDVINIPDLKNKQIQGNKQINHFHIRNNLAYCSTSFALLVINTQKNEIADTYYLGINSEFLAIYECTTVDNTIYAATERGLLTCQLNNHQITYFETWTEISGSENPVVAVNLHNNQLITIQKDGANFSLKYGQQNNWTTLKSFPDFESLSTTDYNLILTRSHAIERYDKDLTLIETINNYTFNKQTIKSIRPKASTYSIYEEAYFIADIEYGLIKKHPTEDLALHADGPYSNQVTDLHATSGGLYSIAGGINQNRPAEYSFYDFSNWSSFVSSNTGDQTNWQDLVAICSSQTDDSKVYFSSWQSGLFEYKDTNPIQYGISENGLQDVSGKIKVSGIASDREGNIWMANAKVQNGIVVKSENDWHQYSYQTTSHFNGTGKMLISQDNFVYTTIRNTSGSEIFVINTNGTLTDDSDDEYRGPVKPSIEFNETRNIGQLKLWDENRSVITNSVYSIVEDKNGQIWLGTDKGVLVYYNPWSIFTEDYPIVNRIKVPRNDGSNLADYLLENQKVLCMATDGANRKWIGTESSGVYLVSDDGLQTFHTFNIDNSPLPSNHIHSLAISPQTGEVFMGTDKGIVSYSGRATEGDQSFNKIYAYPNPVRPDFKGDITITGLMRDSHVKITTASGRLVYETQSLGGKAYWNGTNYNGQEVKTGVYLVFVCAEDGKQSAVTKILVVR